MYVCVSGVRAILFILSAAYECVCGWVFVWDKWKRKISTLLTEWCLSFATKWKTQKENAHKGNQINFN